MVHTKCTDYNLTDLDRQDENGCTMTINILPDDVLLEIFDLCRQDSNLHWSLYPDFTWFSVWGPNGLVHVCRRWRQLIFGSPRRLDLQLPCTHRTPVRKNLDCWPPIPIAIRFCPDLFSLSIDEEDSLFAACEHPDRIRQICLDEIDNSVLSKVFLMMRQPFPVLTHLTIRALYYGERPVIPSGFLAPCLQYMYLEGIPCPELPILLSSPSDIVHLYLNDTLLQKPEVVVACLAALPRLEFLHIEFEYHIEYDSAESMATSRPYRTLLPPITRTSFPVLSSFEFFGTSEYLEDLISQIDSPRLDQIYIEYSYQPFDIQIAQLFQFIDSSEDSKLTLIRHARVDIVTHRVWIVLDPCPGSHLDQHPVEISTRWLWIGGQKVFLAKLFGQPSALLSRVVHLELNQVRAIENCRDEDWLNILRPFSATRTLLLTVDFAGDNTVTLGDINVTGEMVAEILPVLDLICIEDKPVSCIEKFLATRRLSGRPVTIAKSKAEFLDRAKSYVTE
jgi:hypothetical protein